MTPQFHLLSWIVLAAVGVTASVPSPSPLVRAPEGQHASPDPAVEKLLATMSPRQKIAQLVMPWIAGSYNATDDPAFRRIESWVDSLGVGGLIISIGSPLDVAARLNALQRRARVPLLVAADLESGTALRLVGGTGFPSNMGVGATGRDRDAYEIGRITALEGRAVGIHLALAPVADVNNNPANPIINTRSFGEDPVVVARLVAAQVHGLQDHGMFATAKHFPGQGDTEIDSHIALPLLTGSWKRLDSIELVPFRGAISAGVTAVMTAHVAVPGLIPGTPTPATLVPGILTGILRDSLNFGGLVVTDALNMGSVTMAASPGEGAVLAFLAGADILLQPGDPATVIQAMVEALAAGRISQARIDRSVRRVLELKRKAGLFHQRTVPLDRVMTVVGSAAFRDTARAISARSIVLLRDRDSTLQRMRARRGTHSVVVYGDELNPTAGATLASELRAAGDTVALFRLGPASGSASYDTARAMIDQAPSSIIVVAVRASAGRGTIGMPEALARFIDSTAATRPTVLVSLGSPYIVSQTPAVGTFLLGWAANPNTEWAMAGALTGAAIQGHMPVSIPPAVPIGAGVLLRAQGTAH